MGQAHIRWWGILAVSLMVAMGNFPGPANGAEAGLKSIKVANGTTLSVISLPDIRAFEHFLPMNHGLKGEVVYVPGATRAVQAVLAGAADVGIATLAAGISAVNQGQDIVALCLASGPRPYVLIIAHKDIKNLKALEGQPFAILGITDSSYYLPAILLSKKQVDIKKVQWKTVSGGAGRLNALLAGGVKATFLTVDQGLIAMEKGPFWVLANLGEELPDFVFKAFWVKRSFIKQHPEAALSIVKAHLVAAREVYQRKEFLALCAKMLAPETIENITKTYAELTRMKVWDPNDSILNKEAGEFTVREMKKYNVIEKAPPFESWATTEFVGKAIQALGVHK